MSNISTVKTTAVIIGRFQPMHNGHKALITKALAENDQVLILIGSVNKARDFNNPFSFTERLQMITNVFAEVDGDLRIHGLKDKPTEDEWLQEVIANVIAREEDPSKVVLYTSEKDEEFYRSTLLYNVCVLDSHGINATEIRASLYSPMLLSSGIALAEVPKENHALLRDLGKQEDLFSVMGDERTSCILGKTKALRNHQWNNPIEPVCHAVVFHKGNVLLVKRNSVRGFGQWSIPGGFMAHNETTRVAALRELREETGIDLMVLKAKEIAQAVEENIDDLSVRTLGINYAYVIDAAEEVEVTLDKNEVSEFKWCPLIDILTEHEVLFYNHNTVVQRLFAIVGKGE